MDISHLENKLANADLSAEIVVNTVDSANIRNVHSSQSNEQTGHSCLKP